MADTNLTIPAELLSEASALLRPLTRNKIKPILENIRLSASAGSATFAATNLTTSATISGECECSDETVVLLPAGRFLGFASQSPKAPLSISVRESKCVLSSGRAKLSFPTSDPKEYPILTDVSGSGTTVPGAAIRSACRVLFACESGETRYAIGGPAIIADKGELFIAATDARRAAIQKIGSAGQLVDQATPLPYEVGGTLGHIPDGDCEIVIGNNAVQFKSQSMSVTVRRVEGRFPRVMDLFSPQGGATASVLPESMLEILAPAHLLYSEDNKVCSLTLSADSIRIEKKSDLGESSASIPAACSNGVSADYDTTYLREALSSFPAGTSVDLNMKEDDRIFLFSDDYRTILMPTARKST